MSIYFYDQGNYIKVLECAERLSLNHRQGESWWDYFAQYKAEKYKALTYMYLGKFLLGSNSAIKCIKLASEDNIMTKYNLSRTGKRILSDIHFMENNFDSSLFYAIQTNSYYQIGKIFNIQEKYVQARDSLLKIEKLNERESFLMGAIEVKLDTVDAGLKQMQTALDSMKIYHQKVESHRMFGEILLDLGRNDEAKQHLTTGREMAEKSEMKWELEQYDKLLLKLK